MNIITKKEQPILFENVSEFIMDDSYKEHRRGSTFYVKSIIQLDKEDAEHFPSIKNFDDYIGTWETNDYITSEDDTDWDEINTLYRVEKKTIVVETTKWERIQ